MNCTKIRYYSRGAARRARGQIGDRELRPYRCKRAECGAWHLGHLPDEVRRGEQSRRQAFGDGAA